MILCVSKINVNKAWIQAKIHAEPASQKSFANQWCRMPTWHGEWRHREISYTHRPNTAGLSSQAQPATPEMKKNDSSPNFAKGRNVNTIIIPSQLLGQTYDISHWTFHLTCLIKIHKNDKILIRRFLLSFYTGSIHYRKSWVKLFFNWNEYPLIPIITIFWPQLLCKRSFWIDMFSLYNKRNRYPDYNYPEKTWVVVGTRNSISESCI